jgi:hypothetical protein
MSNEVNKYRWNFHNEVEYTIEEYISKVNKLIYSAITQMQECDGDLFMSEYRNLIDGAYQLDYLNDQMKGKEE